MLDEHGSGKVHSDTMETHAILTVVIPVRNRWEELRDCLNALAGQHSSPPFEVIVVDDGSDVPCPDWLLSMSAPERFPVHVRRQEPLGIAAARNQGVALAAGDLILFLDTDSVVAENCLNGLSVCSAEHPDDVAFQLCLSAECETWVGRMDCLWFAAVQTATLGHDGHIAYGDTAGFAVRSSYVKGNRDLFNVGVVRGADTMALAALYDEGHPPRFAVDAIVNHSHNTSLIRYLLKHFSIGYRGGTAAGVAKNCLQDDFGTGARRRRIFRALCAGASKQRRGYWLLALVLIAYVIKVAGRAAYAICALKPGRYDVLGSRVDAVTAKELVATLVQFGARRVGVTATYLNGWTLVQAERDPEFCRLLRTFDLCFADGIAVVYCLLLTRGRRIKKVTANDFYDTLFRESANRGLRLAFVGAGPGIAERAAFQMRQNIPRLEIVFCTSGYLIGTDEDAVLNQLRDLDPHMVIVGRGQPLQEQWVAKCRIQMPGVTFLCVGGLFDYIAGTIRPTPSWIRRIGFEWLHRFYHHPHYWYMYVGGIPLLFWYSFKSQICRVAGLLAEYAAHLGTNRTTRRWISRNRPTLQSPASREADEPRS